MDKCKDMRGKKFGRLLVVSREENDKYGNAWWKCKCNCGNWINVQGSSLRKHKGTRSCKCLQREKASEFAKKKFIDLTGRKFGRLKVLKKVGFDKNNNAIWKCLCRCSKTVEVIGDYLRHGTQKSCKCLQKEAQAKAARKISLSRSINILGKKFGRLRVISRVKSDGSGATWNCICDCGRKKIVRGQSLRNGGILSCKCLKAENIEKNGKRFYKILKRYPYFLLLEKYKTATEKISALCKKHGRKFTIYPDVCLEREVIVGCPQCKVRSTLEQDVYKYLVHLIGKKKISLPQKYRIIEGKRYRPDMVIPHLKLIVEVNGTYWHSPKLKPKDWHTKRRQAFASIDYKTIFLWESDWNTKQEIVKQFIRAKLKIQSLPKYRPKILQTVINNSKYPDVKSQHNI